MEKKTSIPFIIMLAGIVIVLGIKSFIGFGWDDEGYYLAGAHRLWMGDIPVLDEWYPSQFSTVLLLPIYWLYRTVMGTGEGIVLFFRLFYLGIRFVISVFAFFVLRRYSKANLPAFFAAAFLLVFSIENKALYSYSDLAVSFLSLTLLLLLWGKEQTKSKKQLFSFCAGVCLVLTCFANPYAIVLWLYFALYYIFLWKYKKDKSYLISFGVLTVGCCIPGMIFLGSLFTHTSMAHLWEALGHVLNYPGHAVKKPLLEVLKWGWYAIKPYGLTVLLLFGGTILTFRKGLSKGIFYIELLCVILYAVIQYFFMADKNVIGITYIPISVFGLFCFWQTKKKDWEILWGCYLPGILLSIVFQEASDTGIYAMMTGFAISAMASVVLIGHLLQERKELCSMRGFCVFLGMILLYTGSIRVFYCRYSVYETTYNSWIENGPYKGILTDSNQKEFYETSLEELALLEEWTEEDDSILILGKNTWMYLCVDRRIGAPIVWRMEAEHVYYAPYYTMHPDKVPVVIYANELCEVQYGDQILLDGNVYEVGYSGIGKVYGRKMKAE